MHRSNHENRRLVRRRDPSHYPLPAVSLLQLRRRRGRLDRNRVDFRPKEIESMCATTRHGVRMFLAHSGRQGVLAEADCAMVRLDGETGGKGSD